jgi:hypothetical protein
MPSACAAVAGTVVVHIVLAHLPGAGLDIVPDPTVSLGSDISGLSHDHIRLCVCGELS